MINSVTHRYPVAVDLSDSAAWAALQIASGRGVPAVRASLFRDDRVPTEAAMEEDQAAFLRTVLRSRAFMGRSVALAPPHDTILTYPLHLTIGKDESLEAGIVREAGNVLDVPIEEAVIDYVSVRPDPSDPQRSREVLLVAARRADVERLTGIVKRAGGVLASIEPTVTALLRAHGMTAPLGTRPALLCHVGRTCSTLVMASADGVAACRNVAWGTGKLAGKLVENLDLDGKGRDADHLLRHDGLADAVLADEVASEPGAAAVAQLLTPLVDDFTHELHSITGYVRSRTAGVTLAGGYLYGDGARVRGLDGYLSRELDMAVKAVNPLDRIGMASAQAVPYPESGPCLCLALGLGLRRVRWL